MTMGRHLVNLHADLRRRGEAQGLIYRFDPAYDGMNPDHYSRRMHLTSVRFFLNDAHKANNRHRRSVLGLPELTLPQFVTQRVDAAIAKQDKARKNLKDLDR